MSAHDGDHRDPCGNGAASTTSVAGAAGADIDKEPQP